MAREGLMSDVGYNIDSVPWQMCEKCIHSEAKWDMYDHKYYKCMVGCKCIDDCEYEEE